MRHRKLGRTSSHRRALFRSLTTSILRHRRITTTEAKAKAVRPFVEEMISLAKRGDLHARRQAAAFIQDKTVLRELFDEIGPAYSERNGGYTRIIKLGPRRGDASPMAIIELV